MYIYKITNMLNNKFYIGQTINYKSRMQKHISGNDTIKVDRAISHYGSANFKFEVLFECNQVDADLLEMYLILETKSYTDNVGYNVRFCYLTGEEIAKARYLLNCIKSGSYILDNIYLSNTYKQVYCLDDNIEFTSIASCARYYNINATHISDVCLGKRATTSNRRFRYLDDDGNIIEPETSVKKKTVEVYVEETCTIYASIKDACDDLGIDYNKAKSSIGKHLDGRTEHAYGYHFHYVENDEIVPSKYVSGKKKKKKVIVDNLHIFDSVSEAISYYELPANARGAIGQCCNGKSGSAYGHTWSYLDDNNQPIVKDFYYSSIDRSKVKRYEIICDNTLVFRSLAKAVQHFGWNSNELKHISKVCKEGGGMYRGHIWNYGKEI